MNNIIDKLRELYPDKEFVEADIDIIEKCIDGMYTEDDFFYACDKLFKLTKSKSIKIFKNKEMFIEYRNKHRDNFPSWMNDLTKDDKEALKNIYREIISRVMLDHEIYNCEHPEILNLIQKHHKNGIPYWCIRSAVLHFLDYYKPLKKNKLIEYLSNKELIKERCRIIFKKNKDFRKRSEEYLKEIGVIK